MNKDYLVLQELGKIYAEFAADSVNEDRRRLHTAVNDLKMIRPVVLIDEIPWNEFEQVKELRLQCEEPYLRTVEEYIRRKIYQWKNFPADMILPTYIPVQKIIHSTGIGMEVNEKTLSTELENGVVSHEYEDQLDTEEQLEKLHAPVITYDKEETERRSGLLSNIFGDIIPVYIMGHECHVHPWDDIVLYRGLMNILMDLIDRPEFMHATISKMADINENIIKQYEKLNLLEASSIGLHCTSALTSDLPKEGFDPNHVRAKDVWGRAAAQAFSPVSPDMHEEFDIEYMKRMLAPFGLVYYGCCEPLDMKIDIVEKIPNLRKISISPWANIDIASEAIGNRFVVAAKPSPSNVASNKLDKEVIKKEITCILDACYKNNCSCDIVLKDISTISHNPSNLFEWERSTMELVKNYKS